MRIGILRTEVLSAMKTKSAHNAASANIKANRKRLLNNDSPFAVKEAYVKLRTSLMCCITARKICVGLRSAVCGM